MAELELQQEIHCADIIKQIVSQKSEAIILSSSIAKIRRRKSFSLDITVPEIEGESRKAEYTLLRHVSIAITHKLTRLSLKEIGRQYKDRDHSTVIYSIEAIQDRRDTERRFEPIFQEVLKDCFLKVEEYQAQFIKG